MLGIGLTKHLKVRKKFVEFFGKDLPDLVKGLVRFWILYGFVWYSLMFATGMVRIGMVL